MNHLQGVQKPQRRWIKSRGLQKFSSKRKPCIFKKWDFSVDVSEYRLQKRLHVLQCKGKKIIMKTDSIVGEYAHM